ncbi:MAG TPA: hypothetical protein VG253_08805 [Streptosporangiaceae bacterium]|nr:hypothetical protein [Streptosporangiaceae bacterium]
MHVLDTSSPPAVSDGQWELYWTSRGAEIPVGRMDPLDEWAEVDDRERALGIETRRY